MFKLFWDHKNQRAPSARAHRCFTHTLTLRRHPAERLKQHPPASVGWRRFTVNDSLYGAPASLMFAEAQARRDSVALSFIRGFQAADQLAVPLGDDLGHSWCPTWALPVSTGRPPGGGRPPSVLAQLCASPIASDLLDLTGTALVQPSTPRRYHSALGDAERLGLAEAAPFRDSRVEIGAWLDEGSLEPNRPVFLEGPNAAAVWAWFQVMIVWPALAAHWVRSAMDGVDGWKTPDGYPEVPPWLAAGAQALLEGSTLVQTRSRLENAAKGILDSRNWGCFALIVTQMRSRMANSRRVAERMRLAARRWDAARFRHSAAEDRAKLGLEDGHVAWVQAEVEFVLDYYRDVRRDLDKLSGDSNALRGTNWDAFSVARQAAEDVQALVQVAKALRSAGGDVRRAASYFHGVGDWARAQLSGPVQEMLDRAWQVLCECNAPSNLESRTDGKPQENPGDSVGTPTA